MSLTEKSEGRDVALSVTLGARTLSASQTERNYSLGGASHLLAVSGLHVGLLFALLNLLLFPLIFLWRGNILRATAATALVWLYVALCGWPTSAIRAAVMFSVLQLSYLSKSRHMAENSLCSTAFVMLAFDPYMLFELSFQLSFTAVVAILFVARPVTALIRCGGVAKGAVDMTAISTASVLATAPIVSHSFGVVSLLSIVTTPLALLSSQLIIVLNIASLLLPRSVAQITAQSAAWCGSVQNFIVENVVCLGFGYAEYRIGELKQALCYVALALLVLLSFGFRWPRSER
jgi:competence protein ComEC